MGKESVCNAGDPGLILGLGGSSGEKNGNLLQYSCLEETVDRGAWWAAVRELTESDTTERLSTLERQILPCCCNDDVITING